MEIRQTGPGNSLVEFPVRVGGLYLEVHPMHRTNTDDSNYTYSRPTKCPTNEHVCAQALSLFFLLLGNLPLAAGPAAQHTR